MPTNPESTGNPDPGLGQPVVPPLTQDGLSFVDRDIDIACPSCQHALQVGYLHDYKVAGCPNCKGILLQNLVFAEVVRSERKSFAGEELKLSPLDQPALEIQRSCPACGGGMETHPYHGPGNIVIDSCTPCGLVWVDHSELYKIIRAPGQRK